MLTGPPPKFHGPRDISEKGTKAMAASMRPRRDTVIAIVVILICAAALVVGTYLVASGHVAPQPGSGLP